MAKRCSFCNRDDSDNIKILANEDGDACICEYCVEGAYSIIYGEENSLKKAQNTEKNDLNFQNITPKSLKAYLRSLCNRTRQGKKDF